MSKRARGPLNIRRPLGLSLWSFRDLGGGNSRGVCVYGSRLESPSRLESRLESRLGSPVPFLSISPLSPVPRPPLRSLVLDLPRHALRSSPFPPPPPHLPIPISIFSATLPHARNNPQRTFPRAIPFALAKTKGARGSRATVISRARVAFASHRGVKSHSAISWRNLRDRT